MFAFLLVFYSKSLASMMLLQNRWLGLRGGYWIYAMSLLLNMPTELLQLFSGHYNSLVRHGIQSRNNLMAMA